MITQKEADHYDIMSIVGYEQQFFSGVVLLCFIYLANFFLGNTSEECKELQVFSPCQQFINSIKLRTVAHVLMDFLDVRQDTVK